MKPTITIEFTKSELSLLQGIIDDQRIFYERLDKNCPTDRYVNEVSMLNVLSNKIGEAITAYETGEPKMKNGIEQK